MYVLPQVALQRVIQNGIKVIKDNPAVLDYIFDSYNQPFMTDSYGPDYVAKIKAWFLETKIPATQAWSYNVQTMPQISIKLANEAEDESKAAMGDFLMNGDTHNIGVGVFSVSMDIGIHARKDSDEVLWLYYIISYILFTSKRTAEGMGLYLQTFSASDYSRENSKMPDNVWVRWIRFSCTVHNLFLQDPHVTIDGITTKLNVSSTEEDC